MKMVSLLTRPPKRMRQVSSSCRSSPSGNLLVGATQRSVATKEGVLASALWIFQEI